MFFRALMKSWKNEERIILFFFFFSKKQRSVGTELKADRKSPVTLCLVKKHACVFGIQAPLTAHEVTSCSDLLPIVHQNDFTPDFITECPISFCRTLPVDSFENCQQKQLAEELNN